jgi:hypothetical protein
MLYIPEVLSDIPTPCIQPEDSSDGTISECCRAKDEQEKDENNIDEPKNNETEIIKPIRRHSSIITHLPPFHNLTPIYEVVE